MEPEPDFPRGRPSAAPTTDPAGAGEAPAKAARRKRPAATTTAAAADFLFGDGGKAGSGRKKVRRPPGAAPGGGDAARSLLPLGGGGVVALARSTGKGKGDNASSAHGAAPTYHIEALGFARLVKGMRLLGCVKDVYPDLVVFALPNLWTGYMMTGAAAGATSTEDEDARGRPAFSVGQYLGVVLLRAVQEAPQGGGSGAPRRRLRVCARPATVNAALYGAGDAVAAGTTLRGTVQSVQDHGLLVDLGLGRRGFLAFDDIEGPYAVEDDEDNDDEGEKLGKNGTAAAAGTHQLQPGRIDDFVLAEPLIATSSRSVVKLRLPSRATTTRELLVLSNTVSTKNAKSKQSSSSEPQAHTLATLPPGGLVRVTVEALARNGLCVTFGGGRFRGAIEAAHLGCGGTADWRNVLFSDAPPKGQRWTARILAVEVSSTTVRLSLLPHLLALQPPQPWARSTTAFDNRATQREAIVVRNDFGVGAVLALPLPDDESPDRASADVNDALAAAVSELNPDLWQNAQYRRALRVPTVYVHISRAFDEPKEGGKIPDAVFAKEFAPSTRHTVRLLGAPHLIDGMATGATAPSVVNAHVLTHEDLKTGQVYRQVPVCAHVAGGGVLVDFGMGVRGLIPFLHLFDHTVASENRAKMLKSLYAVGAKVDVRVLSVDAATKRCIVTTKKALLKCKNIITSFTTAKVGQKSTGFVSKIDDNGLSVTFFNNVYGRVTARSILSELGIESISENYSIGDAVNCRITNIKSRHDRGSKQKAQKDTGELGEEGAYKELTLSLVPRGSMNDDEVAVSMDIDLDVQDQLVPIRPGTILPLRSMRIVELRKGKEKQTGYVPGFAIVSVKTKYICESMQGSSIPEFIEFKLPFEQLFDEYDVAATASADALDALAEKLLTVGKKINRKGVVLTDPRKTAAEYAAGTGAFALVSIRPKFVEYFEAQEKDESAQQKIMFPTPETQLFVGATVLGYVAQVDSRHGAFIRFLNGLTGLVPKVKGGLELPMFQSVVTQVGAIDVTNQSQKILLGIGAWAPTTGKPAIPHIGVDIGEDIQQAEILSVDFNRAKLLPKDKKWDSISGCEVRLHYSLAIGKTISRPVKQTSDKEQRQFINKFHPFYGLETGSTLKSLKVVSINVRHGQTYVDVSQSSDDSEMTPVFFENASEISIGTKITGVVSSVDSNKGGLFLQISPGVSGFLPALELSDDTSILNNLRNHYPVGCRIQCLAIDKKAWLRSRSGQFNGHSVRTEADISSNLPYLSFLKRNDKATQISLPHRGDLVIGRVNQKLVCRDPPALALELRGGRIARCCITEIDEPDDWKNLPIPRAVEDNDGQNKVPVVGCDHRPDDFLGDSVNENPLSQGAYIRCRVLEVNGNEKHVEVSLRQSRLEGDLEEDDLPETGQLANAYVVDTNKKGCFLRLSRRTEGRAILKEMCDGFLPDPKLSFPSGRLVVGKVKAIHKSRKGGFFKWHVDFDMRESVILSENKIQLDDIEIGGKFKATVTRVEDYGVFVRIENSDCSGLVHKSECSDKFVKNLSNLFDPGDTVKVLVIKKDVQKKQLGFSMKPSHFEGDDESDDDTAASPDTPDDDELHQDVDGAADTFVETSDSENDAMVTEQSPMSDDSSVDGTEDSSSDNESASDGEGTASSSAEEDMPRMDTDVGFDWSGNLTTKESSEPIDDSDDDEEDSEDGDDEAHKTSHKSRRKHAQRLREEQEIARREIALADGTADEKPETVNDFERLLAGSPNSSELWIMYMAFHMSLADIASARKVAERALQRIEFRQEREKMNVWSALMTLELRYGSEKSFADAVDRACQQNNPKYVYLRACEILEKEAASSSGEVGKQCDEMYTKMVKKFKDKKKVWLAHFEYLLKNQRHDEVHQLSKRALLSLHPHKHVEVMSRFAQLLFEFGKPEQARTVFEGLLVKHSKRLDLLFVYVDKELKHGHIQNARELLKRQVQDRPGEGKMKLSDKQMKKLFKKWFSLEEQYGDMNTQEKVKDAARAYVQQTTT